ncbi:hypothetical protein ES332_D05G242100v1 [Gossypium tomentosum]|uniref:Carbonic anhydrase n=1 Tax=Gossypium tomentosum TaxID=34277 RepID=A0A5D2KYU3_GOSTO|nr:hypothetical protein ES332_D05G242100v1 [Gossypium tomentosum]
MAWLIRFKARSLASATRPLRDTLDSYRCSQSHFSGFTTDDSVRSFPRKWLCSKAMRLNDVDDIQSRSSSSPEITRPSVSASSNSLGVGLQEVTGSKLNLFDELKQRFLSFKHHKYLEELEHFETLKEAQTPKFMVIACADSRKGPSETNAALEFAVKTLQVENILIIGHSCCGGIQTLMSMQDNSDSSFIKTWVTNGKNAKLTTESAANHLSFDQQCRLCEKESINMSLMNLLTKVKKELLFVHGGYYDFLNCTFEKWTLDSKGGSDEEKGRFFVKDQQLWC